MRRKRIIKKRPTIDPKFQSALVGKFVNYIMRRGKKTVAQKVVYSAFEELRKKNQGDSLELFDKAIKNISPALEVKSRRIGGANYQVPQEVRGERKIALAFRWLIQAAQSKKGQPMAQKLAEEIILAVHNEGAAVKKKLDMHRMAEANRAFAHFAR